MEGRLREIILPIFFLVMAGCDYELIIFIKILVFYTYYVLPVPKKILSFFSTGPSALNHQVAQSEAGRMWYIQQVRFFQSTRP